MDYYETNKVRLWYALAQSTSFSGRSARTGRAGWEASVFQPFICRSEQTQQLRMKTAGFLTQRHDSSSLTSVFTVMTTPYVTLQKQLK